MEREIQIYHKTNEKITVFQGKMANSSKFNSTQEVKEYQEKE
jgi:hypothetical protein